MSVTDAIFDRLLLAVADEAYIRNRSNTDAQTYNTYQFRNRNRDRNKNRNRDRDRDRNTIKDPCEFII